MVLNDKVAIKPWEKTTIREEAARLSTSLTSYLRARVHEWLLESKLSDFILKGRILQGHNSGAFKIGDQIIWTTSGLQGVLFIKQTCKVDDKQIDSVAQIFTEDGHYVNWTEIYLHFQQLSKIPE